MKKFVFLVNNTQQLLFSLSIIDQEDCCNISSVAITGVFKGAQRAFERVSSEKIFSNIEFLYFENRMAAFRELFKSNADRVYLDSDVSFKNYMLLSRLKWNNKSISIVVFEDGVGTYRTDLYKGLKRSAFNLMGVGTYMGGSPYTTSIYVTDPQRYLQKFKTVKKQVIKIQKNPYQMIVANIKEWNNVFDDALDVNRSSNTAKLYLSAWSIDVTKMKSFFSSIGDKYIKLHPRLQGSAISYQGVRSIGHGSPAELIIAKLLAVYEKVDVYHHGSSVELYVDDPRVKFIKI